MRVMTFNIHSAVGCDGRRDPERIAAVVAAARPDVLALQEVDVRAEWGDPVPLLDRLGEAAGVHRFETWTVSHPGRDYGIAIMSRWPIRRPAVVDLAWRAREPRRAIVADVETPHGTVRVAATHFGLARPERADQAGRLLAALSPVDRPTLVLGDFNDWGRIGDVGRAFVERFPHVVTKRSFPSRMPLFRLDRIYASDPLRLAPLALDTPWRASDHLPVLAEVRFPSGQPVSASAPS